MDPEFGNFDQIKHKARSKSLDASNFFPADFLFCVGKFIFFNVLSLYWLSKRLKK